MILSQGLLFLYICCSLFHEIQALIYNYREDLRKIIGTPIRGPVTFAQRFNMYTSGVKYRYLTFKLKSSNDPKLSERNDDSEEKYQTHRNLSSSMQISFNLYRSEDQYKHPRTENTEYGYGRRSKAWTNQYKSLIPYIEARQAAMSLGLRSKEEWDEYVADGKRYHGPYLPNRPEEMYADDWISWEEFLGIMRPYKEAREIVKNVLLIKSKEEYEIFIRCDPKRAEGLRIPAKPDIVYRGKGWISFDDFFYTNEKSNQL